MRGCEPRTETVETVFGPVVLIPIDVDDGLEAFRVETPGRETLGEVYAAPDGTHWEAYEHADDGGELIGRFKLRDHAAAHAFRYRRAKDVLAASALNVRLGRVL